MKLKKGDTIKILSGKDRGKTANIIRVDTKRGLVLAGGVNLKKKHVRPKQEGKKGEIVQIPAPFNASQAMLVCPSCKRATRLGASVVDGKRVRICKKCKAVI